MKKQFANIIDSKILKKQASAGSLEIIQMRSEERLGKDLLLFIEIEASDRDNEKIITALKKELSEQFFNAPSQSNEYAFENALAKANIKVKDILLSKPKNWLQRIHIAAIALCDDEIHIAPIGTVHAFLVHSQKISDVLSSEPKSAPNPVKIFTNIVSGKLGSTDAIVFTNEAVLDYLSEERIRKCARENEPAEALAKLAELLARAPENKQFGLVVMKRMLQASQAEEPIVKNNKNIKNAAEPREQNKPRILASDDREYQEILPEEQYQELDLPPKQVAKSIQIAGFFKKLTPYLQSALSFALSALLKLLEKTRELIARMWPILSRTGKDIFVAAKNQKARAYQITKIKTAVKSIGLKIISIKNIPKNKQTISGALVLVLIIIFVASIATRARRNQTELTQANAQEIIQTIKNKVNEAEAALIYGNKAGALTLIAETESLVNKAQSEYPENAEQFSAIKNTINAIKMRADKKRAIENFDHIISIIPEPISARQTGIISLNSAFAYYDGAQERIAKIDLKNDLLLSLPLENQGIESFNTALSLSGSAIAALGQEMVLIIDAETETVSKQAFGYDPQTAQRFASFSKNLYSFDTSKNEIIRYRRAGAGFTSAQKWLTQEYELSTIIDIAVDGFIYLLDTQGNIHTFLNGKFRSRLPWPAQDAPGVGARLYTREEIDALYVLDSKNKRIVRLNKQGELTEQLVSDEFSKATDILVDAEEKNMLVLSDDKILSFTLPD